MAEGTARTRPLTDTTASRLSSLDFIWSTMPSNLIQVKMCVFVIYLCYLWTNGLENRCPRPVVDFTRGKGEGKGHHALLQGNTPILSGGVRSLHYAALDPPLPPSFRFFSQNTLCPCPMLNLLTDARSPAKVKSRYSSCNSSIFAQRSVGWRCRKE